MIDRTFGFVWKNLHVGPQVWPSRSERNIGGGTHHVGGVIMCQSVSTGKILGDVHRGGTVGGTRGFRVVWHWFSDCHCTRITFGDKRDILPKIDPLASHIEMPFC